jgi:hypothetical protein
MIACYFIRKADLKVLSTPTVVRNGAFYIIDGLELSLATNCSISWEIFRQDYL